MNNLLTLAKPLESNLQEALDAYQVSKNTLEKVKKENQLKCEHLHIIECGYQSSEYFDYLNPRRICSSCRFEEESAYLTGYYKILHNKENRVIFPLNNRNEFYRLRIL